MNTINNLNITETHELDKQVVPILFPEQIARAKAILAKHPLPAQILEAQAAKAKAAELCETLKQHRLRHHLTQTELADKVGMQKEFISRIENGKVDVQLSTFLKIIEGLGLRVMVTE
jgi:DNA-binding XRE family transcriptional regulator